MTDNASIRIAALKRGRIRWGCAGAHNGSGAPDCPRQWHHHHDEFCKPPTLAECAAARVRWRPADQWSSRTGAVVGVPGAERGWSRRR